MASLIATVLFTVALIVAAPAVRANHDSGQGKSQDHLHGKSLDDAGTSAFALQVVAVPQAPSLLLLGLGAVATAVAVFYSRRRPN